jgi:hypothetical protein
MEEVFTAEKEEGERGSERGRVVLLVGTASLE